MDTLLLGEEHKESRTFWRISRNGYSPARKRSSLGNERLLDVIAKQSGYEDTRDIYEHRLWLDVLGPIEISIDTREALISELFQRLRLYRPSDSDVSISREMRLGMPEIQRCTEQEFRAQLSTFIWKQDLDYMMLLCLLYRHALGKARLEEAICLRDAIFASVERYCEGLGLGTTIKTIWLYVVNRRVICGDRILDPSLDPSEQQGERYASLIRYVASIQLGSINEQPIFPIIERNQNIEQYLSHKYELKEIARSKMTTLFARYIRREINRFKTEGSPYSNASELDPEMYRVEINDFVARMLDQ